MKSQFSHLERYSAATDAEIEWALGVMMSDARLKFTRKVDMSQWSRDVKIFVVEMYEVCIGGKLIGPLR